MADDIANLGFAVDTKELEKANKELDALNRSARKAGDGAESFSKDANKASLAADRVGKQARGASMGLAAMGKALRAAGAAAAAMGAALLGALSIRQFVAQTVEAERVLSQLQATLRSTNGVAGQTAKSVLDFSRAMQRVTVFGDEAVTAGQSLLLTFTKVGGEVFPRAMRAALDLSTAMGSSLQTAVIQVGKALNDPIRGVSALGEAGIQFTDSQRSLIRSLVETNRVAEAQVIILKELETQFGGSAEAARNTLGGALQAIQNAWGDLFEITGPAAETLRNAVEQLINTLADGRIISAVQSIGQGLFVLASAALGLVNDILQLIGAFEQFNGMTLLVQTTVGLLVAPIVAVRRVLIGLILVIRLTIEAFKGMAEVMLNIASGDWVGAFNAGKNAIDNMAKAMKDAKAQADALLGSMMAIGNIGASGGPLDVGTVGGRPSGGNGLPTVHRGLPNLSAMGGGTGGVVPVKLDDGSEIRVHRPSMAGAVSSGVEGLVNLTDDVFDGVNSADGRLEKLVGLGGRLNDLTAEGNRTQERSFNGLISSLSTLANEIRNFDILRNGNGSGGSGGGQRISIAAPKSWITREREALEMRAQQAEIDAARLENSLIEAQVREVTAKAQNFELLNAGILQQSGYLNDPAKMATGGVFDVPMGGARDSRIPNIRLDGGERVTVTPRNQVNGTGSAPAVNVTVVVQGVRDLAEFKNNQYVIEQQAREAISRATVQSLRGG